MTTDPRFSPPPRQTAYHVPNPAVPPTHTAPHPLHPGNPGHTGWGHPPHPGAYPGPPGPPRPRRRRSGRTAALTAGAAAIAIVSAGIGGGVATLAHQDRPAPVPGAPPSTVIDSNPARPAAEVPLGSVEQVAAKVVPSVVTLETFLGRQFEEGSGIIYSDDGLVLTNSHVVAAAANRSGDRRADPETMVTFADGHTAEFTVVGTDPASDIAVVRIQGASTGFTPITIGSSANLRVGQQVVAIGSPLGLQGTVTSGIVSSLNRPVSSAGDARNQSTVLDAIQTDAAINPGNSGGALVNMNGELVGINSAIATLGGESAEAQSGSIGLGFAIPIDQAKRIADELIATGRASHASLGVMLAADSALHGAKVVEVIDDGAAARAGLPSDVVITRCDDRPIGSANGLIAAVRSKAPGDTITLTFQDSAGDSQTVQVTLGEADD
ncbi:trypsin-like peptidase domain-containing protein [Mycolicibacillus parakoreensis]|uniref:Trypsin-like peptidase domain-containing protein n=1 Tax=Mycolicibacillus parakoreensis TaxID=1069221 RepID=A0ABY3U6T1_9MYCO|nr:trypsin-like peptidase domain-containing protein [Mycolicibacillus parakoreensis]MCV7315201.1 trypsin-like peptidase domain-containing protein [Mycolicibacillus parakoreensis]ULN53461.1 trypsin-like peptidase domain-containing protein [Mycolicibacillus parakoreensis]HLR98969.1 trypsin-like peptidase domain-containing protein [Mycolicibacillus parakoreensis]